MCVIKYIFCLCISTGIYTKDFERIFTRLSSQARAY